MKRFYKLFIILLLLVLSFTVNANIFKILDDVNISYEKNSTNPLLKKYNALAVYVRSYDKIFFRKNLGTNPLHVVYHELIHATGHYFRLNRYIDPYSEEIVAEFGAHLLAIQLGTAEEIDSIETSTAYLSGHSKARELKDAELQNLLKLAKEAVSYILKNMEKKKA